MTLIDVLLSLFDSFSIKIEGLLGVGTIINTDDTSTGNTISFTNTEDIPNNIIWYVYFVTPETINVVDTLIAQGLILCKRDINLFINSPCKLDVDTNISISDKLLETLVLEIDYLSKQSNPSCNSYITHVCKYLEFNMELT